VGAAGEAARAEGAAHHAVEEAAEPPGPLGVVPAVGATDVPESLDHREALGIARLDAGTRRQLVEPIDRLATDPHVGTVLKGELDGRGRA
jgi:hypothetical protein